MQNPAATIMQTHPVKHWAHLKPKFLLGDRTCSSIPNTLLRLATSRVWWKWLINCSAWIWMGFNFQHHFQQIVQMFPNFTWNYELHEENDANVGYFFHADGVWSEIHDRSEAEDAWETRPGVVIVFHEGISTAWDPDSKLPWIPTHCVFFVESVEVMLHWGNHFETFHNMVFTFEMFRVDVFAICAVA